VTDLAVGSEHEPVGWVHQLAAVSNALDKHLYHRLTTQLDCLRGVATQSRWLPCIVCQSREVERLEVSLVCNELTCRQGQVCLLACQLSLLTGQARACLRR